MSTPEAILWAKHCGWSGNPCVAGILQEDNLTESSVWQQNDAGQDFQLMEQRIKQRQHKITAAAFCPVLLTSAVVVLSGDSTLLKGVDLSFVKYEEFYNKTAYNYRK